jgi:MurNAc alpha-1-phosphate uridylyltransferase
MTPTLPIAILSGGLATRLRPLTRTVPKAMLPVAGEPFVAHQLRLLRRQGIERAVVCAGHLGETIRQFVGDGRRFGLDVEFSFDGPRLLGTAGALRKALPLLGDSFLVIYGDSYLPCDYRGVQEVFQQSGRQALMTVFRNEGRFDRSNVEFDGRQILRYDKARPDERMRHIDGGLGALRAAALEAPTPDGPSDLADLYRRLLDRGELAACEVQQRFYEIGSFAGLEELSMLLGAEPQPGTLPVCEASLRPPAVAS